MENNAALLKQIRSGEPELIAAAVKEIQENGDLGIAAALLEQLDVLEDDHVVSLVSNLLSDIKESKFRELLVARLEGASTARSKGRLLRIVWESALDYSAHLDLFLRLLREEDFTVAFEASTVIENLVHHLAPGQLERLHEAIHGFPEEKRFLVDNIHEEMGCCGEEEETACSC